MKIITMIKSCEMITTLPFRLAKNIDEKEHGGICSKP
jgi:hypothetical protein